MREENYGRLLKLKSPLIAPQFLAVVSTLRKRYDQSKEIEAFNRQQIIEKFEELYSGGSDVKIYWYYVDEDMQELGDDYRNIVELPFQLIEFSMN